jgi:hypothetical protein
MDPFWLKLPAEILLVKPYVVFPRNVRRIYFITFWPQVLAESDAHEFGTPGHLGVLVAGTEGLFPASGR